MIRMTLTALILSASAAMAHNHWGDLDGDGFLEPSEFDIGGATFEDADANNDGVISPGEYDALIAILSADEGVAVPEGAVPGETGLDAGTVTTEGIEPNIISVDD
jgi:hypothetical protein